MVVVFSLHRIKSFSGAEVFSSSSGPRDQKRICLCFARTFLFINMAQCSLLAIQKGPFY